MIPPGVEEPPFEVLWEFLNTCHSVIASSSAFLRGARSREVADWYRGYWKKSDLQQIVRYYDAHYPRLSDSAWEFFPQVSGQLPGSSASALLFRRSRLRSRTVSAEQQFFTIRPPRSSSVSAVPTAFTITSMAAGSPESSTRTTRVSKTKIVFKQPVFPPLRWSLAGPRLAARDSPNSTSHRNRARSSCHASPPGPCASTRAAQRSDVP